MPTSRPPEKVRTTLMLPGVLVRHAKHYALDVDRDLQEVVADALTEYLARHDAAHKGSTR